MRTQTSHVRASATMIALMNVRGIATATAIANAVWTATIAIVSVMIAQIV